MQGEHQYWVETALGERILLPYSEAKKRKLYPQWCVSLWHEDADHPMRAATGSNLCDRCTDILRDAWQAIADRWSDLEEVLAVSRQPRAGERTGNGALLGSPLPFDADVSEVMGKARSAVWSVIGCLLDDRSVSMPADHSTDVLAGWLAKWQVDYVASHPSTSHSWIVLKEAYDVAGEVKSQAYRAGPAEVPLRQQCMKWTDDGSGARVPCTGDLVGVEQPDGSKVVECTVDPMHAVPWDVWLQVSRAQKPRPARAKSTLLKRHAQVPRTN